MKFKDLRPGNKFIFPEATKNEYCIGDNITRILPTCVFIKLQFPVIGADFCSLTSPELSRFTAIAEKTGDLIPTDDEAGVILLG